MERNKALQTELISALENIKNQLDLKHREIYAKEFAALKIAIQQSVSPRQHGSFFEQKSILKCMMEIIHKIDKEIASVEKVMHGMEFYPSDTKRLQDIKFKKLIKDELTKLCSRVASARSEVDHTFEMFEKRFK